MTCKICNDGRPFTPSGLSVHTRLVHWRRERASDPVPLAITVTRATRAWLQREAAIRECSVEALINQMIDEEREAAGEETIQ